MDGQTEEQTVNRADPAQQQTNQEDTALAERLNKLEAEAKEQRSYLTKLEQENATYRQIITDRGQTEQKPQTPAVSVIDSEIAELERQVKSGEIDSEEFQIKSLRLIKQAKETGKNEAVSEIQNLYQREQEINREYSTIFQDADLKGLDQEMGDIAAGYFQYAVGQGMSPKQAAQYAKDNTKAKINAFKARFGGTNKQAAEHINNQTEVPAQKPSGFTGEGEGNKQPKEKEKPVTPEESQKSFIQLRREKLSRIQSGG